VSLHREGRGNPEVVAPFFDKLQVDVVGGVIGVIEFAVIPCPINAEKLRDESALSAFLWYVV
jgi:hypothetical protein